MEQSQRVQISTFQEWMQTNSECRIREINKDPSIIPAPLFSPMGETFMIGIIPLAIETDARLYDRNSYRNIAEMTISKNKFDQLFGLFTVSKLECKLAWAWCILRVYWD